MVKSSYSDQMAPISFYISKQIGGLNCLPDELVEQVAGISKLCPGGEGENTLSNSL
jgi:hypothetical protein